MGKLSLGGLSPPSLHTAEQQIQTLVCYSEPGFSIAQQPPEPEAIAQFAGSRVGGALGVPDPSPSCTVEGCGSVGRSWLLLGASLPGGSAMKAGDVPPCSDPGQGPVQVWGTCPGGVRSEEGWQGLQHGAHPDC